MYRDVPTVRTLGVAAYVGVPLVAGGQTVGAFGAIDTRPRAWTAGEVEILTELAASAQRELDLRAAVAAVDRTAAQLQTQQAALEASNQQLQEQAAELEAQAEALHATAEALAERTAAAEAAEGRLQAAFAQAPAAVAVTAGPEHRFVLANAGYAGLVGRPVRAGQTFAEALPEIAAQDYAALLTAVYATGAAHVAHESHAWVDRGGAAPEEGWYNFVYQPLTDAAGRVTAVMQLGIEVTDQVRARQAVERLLAESEQARAAADAANAQLLEQGLELELSNQQLQDQATELELQAEVLQATAAQLEERTEEAEAERARATGILETMADAHFVLDAAFRFVRANAAMERAVRHTRDQLLGRTVWEVFPGTVGTVFEASYRRVVAERVAVHFTGDYDAAGLALVPEVNAYPTADGGVAVFWRDVRARVQAEAALRASEQRLRDIFEQAPVAVAVMTGPDHVYTAVSPLYAASPGLGRPLLGRPMREAFPEVVGSGYIDAMHRVYETGLPFAAAERAVALARPGDGVVEERFFNIGYQPLRDPAGRVYAVASVAYDVTEQVHARQAVEAARAEAEAARREADAANQAKSAFLATMSHELRTPLNAIGGYAQLLALGIRGPVTDAQRNDLDRLRRANEHMAGLVDAVLNFTRLTAGQVEYHVEIVPLGPLVQDLEALVGPQLAAKGLIYDHDGCGPETPDRPHIVRADPEKVRQVLLNLLTNAIKFTDAGGRVSLACEADAVAGVMRVRVTDTGQGIVADQLARIFDPFVQIDRQHTHASQQGVGLGLAISRDLARGMGGDLTVESTPSVGSTFTLTLPRGTAPDGPE